MLTNFELHLLNDEFPLRVVREVVGLEEVALEERPQILDLQMTSLIQQISLRDFDDLLFGAVSIPEVDGSLLGQLPQREQKQFVVVTLEGEVPGKVPLHRLHHRELL